MRATLRRDLRTRRFWRYFATSFFSFIGVAASILGLSEIFVPEWVENRRGLLSAVVVGGSVIFAANRSWPRPIEQKFDAPKTVIEIVEGDLFDQTDNLVIGFCDTFDTSTPNIISKTSVQGQFLERIYGGDVQQLDSDLSSALSEVATTGSLDKKGKTQKYPQGTVAVIHKGNRRFFCVAYTTINAANVVQGSVDGLWQSLNALWESVASRANGEAVSVPVLGGGLSRLSQILPAQFAIRFIVFSFLLASRRSPVCEQLTIVVRPKDAADLDMLELRAFLRSLRAS